MSLLTEVERKQFRDSLDIAYFQRFLGRGYNIFLKTLNKDGYIKFCELINKYNGPINDIKKLIESPDALTNWEKEFNDDLCQWICPIETKYRKSSLLKLEKDEIESFDKAILSTIFRVFPDGLDPILAELKYELPFINVLFRLHYLQIIWQFSKTEYSDKIEIINPIGYTDKVLVLKGDHHYFPVISMVWVTENFTLDTEIEDVPLPLLIENNLFSLIQRLESKCDHKLSTEHYAYLLHQLLAYQIIQKQNLEIISSQCSSSFNILLALKNRQNREFNSLHYSKKIKLIETIPFILSQKAKYIFESFLSKIIRPDLDINTNKLCIFDSEQNKKIKNDFKVFVEKNYKGKDKTILNSIFRRNTQNQFNDFIDYLQSKTLKDINIEFNISLADRTSGHRDIIQVTLPDIEVSSSTQIDFENEFEFKLISNADNQIKQNWINLSHPHLGESFFSTREKEKLESIIHYYLNKTRRDNHSRMIHRGRTFFNVIRNNLEKEDMIDLENKYKQISRSAMQMTLASFSIYLDFNSIEDRLETKDYRLTHCLNNILTGRGENAQNLIADLKTKMDEHFKEWALENENIRKESSNYISLDQIRVISQFKQKDGIGLFFADTINEDVDGINRHDIDECDRLIIPVLCHNRVVGILYLTSVVENQFTYIDRLRMVNFAQTFGVEIFKSKLLNTIQNFELFLEEVLRNPKEQAFFFDKLAIEVARLLGSVGSIITWATAGSKYLHKIIGRGGTKTSAHFGTEGFISVRNDFLKETYELKVINYIELDSIFDDPIKLFYKNIGYESSIQIPISNEDGDILGFIILFDKHKLNTLSEPFKKELKLIALEIKQVVTNFFDTQGKFITLRNILMHDIDSSLKSISSVRDELVSYKKWIEDEHFKMIYEYKLKDINTYIRTIREISEYFAGSDLEKDIMKLGEKGHYLKRYTDRLKKLFSIKDSGFNLAQQQSDINYILNNVLHSHEKLFQKKLITYSKAKLYLPKLWINYPVIIQILNNLVDNVVKYSEQNSKFIIDFEETYTEWLIHFNNSGVKLNEHAAKDAELIFSADIRCVDETKFKEYEDGKGMGMYVARELIRNYGGYLDLTQYHENIEYADYTFTLTIPFFLGQEINPWK